MGASRIVSLTLHGNPRLSDLLTHLYVLIPVLDATKHYYFGDDELEKLLYRDARLGGYDAAAVVEVVEHLDPARLAAFERVLFEAARPQVVALTTPNAEYNVRFPTLAAGAFRHADHRFEWTRAEFHAWAERVAAAHGYEVTITPIGPKDPEVGAPSQLALFQRR